MCTGMLINKNPWRFSTQIFRAVVAVSVAYLVTACVFTVGETTVSVSADDDVELDGLYLTYKGTATIYNSSITPFEDVGLKVYAENVKTGSRVLLSEKSDINVDADAYTQIPINIKAPWSSVAYSLMDSMQTEGSHLRVSAVAEGKCVFGIVPLRVDFSVDLPLAQEGKTLEYDVVVNETNIYQSNIDNLSDKLLSQNAHLFFTNGASSVSLQIMRNENSVSLVMLSHTGLDNATENLLEKPDTIQCNVDGYSGEAGADILRIMQYVRWLPLK